MTANTQTLRPIPLALSLATFGTVGYLGCLALALVVPDRGLHGAWLQFLPGFAWTAQGMLLGLVESFGYGFVAGIIFAPIFNFYNAR